MDANSALINIIRFRCFNPRARDGRERCDYFKTIAHTSFNPRARDGREL